MDLCIYKPKRINYTDGMYLGMRTVVVHHVCDHCDHEVIIPDEMTPEARGCPKHKPKPIKAKWNVPTKKDYPAKKRSRQ